MELPQQNGTAAHSERAFLPLPQLAPVSWLLGPRWPVHRVPLGCVEQPRFETYVDGYRDLDVGNVTGRVVTQLKQGTNLLLSGASLQCERRGQQR